MEGIVKKIVREEFESVLSKTYSEDEIREAINKKHFIHTKDGSVYSPVILKRGFVLGVNNDCQHVDIPLEEITLVQSREGRFGIK
jgi:hypothetical protein